MAADQRESAVYLSRLAERTERYGEMVEAIKSVAIMNVELTAEERVLLSIGYTKMFASGRAALRVLASIKQKEESKGNQLNVEQIKVYTRKVETEITNICEDLKTVLNDHVIPSSTSGDSSEDHVFYHKMIGDAYRYCAESKTGDDKEELGNMALEEYLMATAVAEEQLPSTNATRLGLAFSLSVLYYDILDSRESACKVAEDILDAAFPLMEAMIEGEAKESLDIMQLLRDNLTIWNAAIDIPEINEGLNAVENGVDNGRGAGA